jgi:twinkle protein
MTDVTPAYVAKCLAAKVEDAVRWILPEGKKVNKDWCVGSVKGEPGNSLKVALEGENAGRWSDFAVGDKSGDLVDLIAATQDKSLGESLKLACDWLGVDRPTWNRKKSTAYVKPEAPKNACGLSKAPSVQRWLAARKISDATTKRYRIFADGDGVVLFPYMRDNEVLHIKYRSVREKKFWSSAGTEKLLFGWQGLDKHTRAVCLTEGEMDTLALAEYGLQSLSIPFGAGTKDKQDWIENEWDNLSRFDTIYLAMDMDGSGQKTVQELAERLGRERCRVIKLPRKDANACLMEGIHKGVIIEAVRAAKTLDPEELRGASDFEDDVIDRFYPKSLADQGFKLPWFSVATNFTAGWGETTIIAGYAGHGKSEICGQIALDAMRQKERVCVASLEFKSSKWIQRLIRQATTNELPPVALIKTAFGWMSDSLWAVDIYGSAKADRILQVFEYAYRRYGVRVFVIDNFTKLGIADDNLAEQKRVMNCITEFSVKFSVHVILVHHLRKEETDYANTNMSKLSLKGSSSIGDLADNIFLCYRNRAKEKLMKSSKFMEMSPEDQEEARERPDTQLICEKYRNGDDEPRLNLFFDRKSHLWIDQRNAPVHSYVKVSA